MSERFRISSNLKVHQLIHSNERQFVCDWSECGKRFNEFHTQTTQTSRSFEGKEV